MKADGIPVLKCSVLTQQGPVFPTAHCVLKIRNEIAKEV